MDGLDARGFSQGSDSRNVGIGRIRSLRLRYQVRLIGLEAMDAETIFLGVDGDRAQSKVSGRSEDADSNFRAIGCQKPGEGSDADTIMSLLRLHLARHYNEGAGGYKDKPVGPLDLVGRNFLLARDRQFRRHSFSYDAYFQNRTHESPPIFNRDRPRR